MARKLAKKQQKKENPGLEITGSILEYVLALFVCVICIFLPLYMENAYYKIGDAKFKAYAYITVFGLPVILLLLLIRQSFVWKETGFGNSLKTFFKDMTKTDICFAAYMLIALVSFFASGNLKQAFWGYSGWYMGLFFQLTIFVLYLLLSRFGVYHKLVFSILCIISFITYIIGILHRLLIDVVGTYEGISDYYKTQFLSTLGQASWYSSFVCSTLPIGIGCYFIAKKLWVRLLSGVFCLIGFMTLVSQNSDSAYIAFVCMMLVLFYFAVQAAPRMMRLCEIFAMFLIAPKIMQGLLLIHPNATLSLDRLSSMLLFTPMPWILLGVTGLLWGILFLLGKKDRYPEKAFRILRSVVYVLFGVFVLASVLLLVLSAGGKLTGAMLDLAEKVPYLKWDDQWGNGRGFTWTASAKIISEFSPAHKLIGVGPDCYASYAYANYAEWIRSKWGDNVLTNAHNEWLNMIVNYGFLGAASYLGIFVTSLVSFARRAEEMPALIGFACCIAAYMGHNLFCYQQVLCTPFVIMAIGYGWYLVRNLEPRKEKDRPQTVKR